MSTSFLLAIACGNSDHPAGPVDSGAAGNGAGGSTNDAAVSDAAMAGETSVPTSFQGFFPQTGAASACSDPPLRLSFNGPPTLGSSGKIQLWDASQPSTPVASLDMSMMNVMSTIGGLVFTLPRPVYVDGNDVIAYLHSGSLGFGKTLYVTIDAGAITGPDGAAMSIADANTWHFTTKAAAPADPAAISVALDGSADFCSVQGAVDAVPNGNTAPTTISIAAGTYREVVHFRAKNNVTLHGQDRKGTVIAGINNNALNPNTTSRSLIGIDNSSGIVVENMTMQNLTPPNASQSETLRLQACDQCVVRDADIIGNQDTLLWEGRIYANNCYIAGNVDFVWGRGTVYFNNCEIKTVSRTGYNVQARNGSATYGYVFVDSKLTADTGITGDYLARIDVSSYPGSHVAYINCQMGSHIIPAGWLVIGAAAPDASTSALRFWEYQSVDPNGMPIDVSQRIASSLQLSADQAALMRDPTVVLAGWQPPQ
ncbi:MAG TPA: pectinesterase family protein [Polyangiaceae bacterium]